MRLLSSGKEEKDPKTLQYMSEVDRALHQRGHPYAFICTLAVLAFLMAFLIWARFAYIDDGTRGSGQVIPAAGVNPVQSDKGGTIDKILVKENEEVTQEQTVAMLSNIEELAALRDLQNKSIELTLSIIRLEAEAMDADLFFPPELEERYPDSVYAQTSIYKSRQQQFMGEEVQFEAQLEQREKEVEEARERMSQYSDTLEILRQEEETVRPLVGRSYSQIQYLDLQQRIVTQEGELEGAIQAIPKAESGVSVVIERRNARRAERRSYIAEELNRNRIELASVQERIKVSTDQVVNTSLRAPITGTVKRVLLKEGSVAKPAETIMEIIPSDGVLEIEAKFKPEDRGFLYVSQDAVIKFAGYDFSIYGGLDAKIIRISEDTIEDKRGDAWYEVRFITKDKYLTYQGKALEIHPGMPVMVDVLTAKRSVFDILMSPILKARDNAMTER